MNSSTSGTGHVPIFMLTVDGAEGHRRRHVQKHFMEMGLDVIFVEGLRANSPEVRSSYSAWRNRAFAKRRMTATEVAVYLGHRRIWEIIRRHGHDVALVLEDDACVIDSGALRGVLYNARNRRIWDVLKLFDYKPKPIKNTQDWHDFTIVDYKYPASGCVAYLITGNAADALLQRRSIYRPVDEDMSWCWEFGLMVRSISPNICTEASDRLGGSLIEPDRAAARRNTPLLRRLNGFFLAAVKQVRAKRYLARVIAAGRPNAA